MHRTCPLSGVKQTFPHLLQCPLSTQADIMVGVNEDLRYELAGYRLAIYGLSRYGLPSEFSIW
jgi:hypothetical protein